MEHELSMRVRPHDGREEPKRVKERTKEDDLVCIESTTNVGEPRRLIPNASNKESKRAELLNNDEDSK